MTGVRAALAVLAMVAAGPVTALTAELMCPSGDSSGTPSEIASYDHWPAGDGFVAYLTLEYSSNEDLYILEQCARRRQLVLRLETGQVDSAVDAAAYGMFEEMIFGPDGYTMTEMARRLRDLGAVVEMRTVNYESCACANQ
jgi:hypothetical protein